MIEIKCTEADDGIPVYKTVMETMQDKPCFKLVHGIGPTVYAVE